MPASMSSPGGFGERIRAARLRSRLSQTELGIRVGVSQPTVAHWERGLHAPRPAHRRAVASVLKAPELAGDAADARPTAEPTGYLARPLRHVPILDWPAPGGAFRPDAARARDHLPASTLARDPFALTCTDRAMAHAFPPGSIVVFDFADRELSDGSHHLIKLRGRYVVRRWRAAPHRVETEGGLAHPDTVHLDAPPRAYGRAVLAVRDLSAD